MILNIFKTAWRNLVKNKSFSLINVAGLSIGMAACLMILQYVSFELSYDQFNKSAADIYRVYNDRYQNGKLIQHGTITYSAVGKALQDDYPEVVNHARVMPQGKSIISYGNKKVGDEQVLMVDNAFLSMFSYPLVAGDGRTALRDPYTIMLSETSARKIFGTQGNFGDLLGQSIKVGTDPTPYKVTGVFKDLPENSHLKFDLLGSYVSLYSGVYAYKQADYDFTDSDFWHYIQLKHGTDYKALEAKLPAFSERHFHGNKVSGSVEQFHLQPLLRAHLYSDFEYEIGDTASAVVVWGLLAIALLIIVIAWVNYINLTTAKSLERAREVGIRKVSGATRRQLMRQFLIESTAINIIALALSGLLVIVSQHGFNTLTGHELSLWYLFEKGLNGYSITVAMTALILTGIVVSGLYPAIVLSSFRPILVLKGKFTTSGKGIVLRKVLVTAQFAVTVALIIGSLVVYRQIRFVSSQDLGFNLAQTMVLAPPVLTPFDSTFIEKENSLTTELRSLPHVLGASSSARVPGDELARAFDIYRTDAPTKEHFTMRRLGAGLGFIELYHFRMLAGRSFVASDYNADYKKVHNVIANESALKMLGFRSVEDALGKEIHLNGSPWTIVGVVRDFHQKSLKYALEPTLLQPLYSTYGPISVKVDPHDLPSTIAAIREQYNAFFPGNLFDYYFLDEHFNQQYKSDQLFGKVFAIFAGFAIFIACLGLLGLSLLMTTQRTKEIGVRKVLGASVTNIVFLLSQDFVRLVLVAFVIAVPLAWYVMHGWLQNFAYRVTMNGWMFLTAGMLALVVALGTISFQAVKAAMAKPVNSLRTE